MSSQHDLHEWPYNNGTRMVVLDLETTGLHPERGDRIIEIGAVRLIDYRVADEFHSLIQPDRSIPRAATAIHGLTSKKLAGAPPPEDIFPRFAEFIERTTLVAHNAAFDIPFLRKEFSRFKLKFDNPVLCTLKLTRKKLPELPNYRLGSIARYLLGDISGKRLHRALEDARLTACIWLALEEMGKSAKQ